LVYEALKKAHRDDLIGYNSKCLIRPNKRNLPTPKQQKRNLTFLKSRH